MRSQIKQILSIFTSFFMLSKHTPTEVNTRKGAKWRRNKKKEKLETTKTTRPRNRGVWKRIQGRMQSKRKRVRREEHLAKET